MQPFTAEFAQTQLTAQANDIVIGNRRYRASIDNGIGWVCERWPGGEKKYQIVHSMGGKNVYYFLTPMERGRLQVLPVAFDVRRREWFDTAYSALRHFTDLTDEALDWTDRSYTFNTSCYGCHVSQLSTNYDLKTDTYHTTWVEPGINCETCHGPAAEHIRVCREAPKGRAPKDLKIIRGGKDFTAEQVNAACVPCHAKMIPLTTTFQPGDRYFDHYDLVTLEHPDFYPDGRDLGENYTYTLWLTSPCLQSSQLTCLHCHTSSGRYRFKGEMANNACMPCHQNHVKNPTDHTHHPVDSEGNKCIACHMPKTEFARMLRSDHSMRPPTPAATIAYKSPNACNICHNDQDAAWADKYVREWRQKDYQAPVLHRAGLIDAARKRDWARLPEILAYLASEDHNEVYATSLIRLLRASEDESKWPVILKALKDPSPLVRAAAAEALMSHLTPESVGALLMATGDDYRLVRIRSAAALASFPREMMKDQARKDLEYAMAEFETAMNSRPDDYTSHCNLGNFYMDRNEFERAVAEFETAVKLQPDNVTSMVNASLAYNLMGQNAKAEESLRRALKVEPANTAANLNLGLLLGEQGRVCEAEVALRTALKTDPQMAVAAYNLSVLLAKGRIDEAISWVQKAAELRPSEPKYAYTLAFYKLQKEDTDGAIDVLRGVVQQQPIYTEAYLLLGEIYEKQGKSEMATDLYRQALNDEGLSKWDRYRIKARLQAIVTP